MRNFLYSKTLDTLAENARVTLLSVLDDEAFVDRFEPLTEAIIPIDRHPEHPAVNQLRSVVHDLHFRWLWSEVAKNVWELRDLKARTPAQRLKRSFVKAASRPLANRPTLRALTALERSLTWRLRPSDHYVDLFRQLQPDLVFNCSHIHGRAGELPMKVAARLGIPTAGFIFSWDNLTSRSRIFVPYDDFLVWHHGMRDQLLDLYPQIDPARVHVTGTPQFDFHTDPRFRLSRGELAERLGTDPERPFVLYTTGIAKHFPEEHRTVEYVSKVLQDMDPGERPQLVVRTYVKGTSDEMKALAKRHLPGVVFPEVAWDEKWATPMYEDLATYTSTLRHTALGINAASTVSLELMMYDKPVINLGFDPPGSGVPHAYRWIRHIEFDHYRPVAASGGTMVAYSPEQLREYLHRGLAHPEADRAARRAFIDATFGDTLDGHAGERVAHKLLHLAAVPTN
ncbi:MAG: hypothetical protein AAF791_00255 [Bacteroidota bacterium]